MRLVKAFLVILSALFSCLFILWLGAQTRPDRGTWSFALFWNSLPVALLASSVIFGAGVNLAVNSKKLSMVLSVTVPLGISLALRIWNWPSLALILPGAFASLLLTVYPRAWKWAAAISVFLTAWWFGVTTYDLYDYFKQETTVRGGQGIAVLFVAHFLMVGSSAAIILLVARTSGGSRLQDGVHR
jgi:hypothetical protein